MKKLKYINLFEEFKINSEGSYNIGDTITDVPGSRTSIVVRIDENGKPQSVMARYDVLLQYGINPKSGIPLSEFGSLTQRDIKELHNSSDAKSIDEILRLDQNGLAGNSGWRLPLLSEVDIMRKMYKGQISPNWQFTRLEKPLYLYSNHECREFWEMDPNTRLTYQLKNKDKLRLLDFAEGGEIKLDPTSQFNIRLVYDLYNYKYSDTLKDFVKTPRFEGELPEEEM